MLPSVLVIIKLFPLIGFIRSLYSFISLGCRSQADSLLRSPECAEMHYPVCRCTKILDDEKRIRLINNSYVFDSTMTQEENMEKNKKKSGVSRREFIAGTVGGVVVGAVVGAAAGSIGFPKTVTQTLTQTTTATTTAVSQPWMPTSWDYVADVVVVGGGAAGLSAAYEAANAGSKVIVVEKDATLDGDSTRPYSELAAAYTSLQKSNGVTDSPDLFYADLTTGAPRANAPLMRFLADNSNATYEWMVGLGCTFKSQMYQNTGTQQPRCHVALTDARQWIASVQKAAVAKGVQIMFSTPATKLIRDPTRGVIGVYASSKAFKANKAVILSAGGQNGSKALLEEYGAPDWWASLPTGGSPSNTGDGILLAMGVGGMPVILDQNPSPTPSVQVLVANGYKSPSATMTVSSGTYPGVVNYAIYVNKAGNRYTNELGGTVGMDTYNQPGSASWIIFDNQVPSNSSIAMVHWAGWQTFTDWMNAGVISQANTLSDLATKLGIDPAGLTAAVAKYNGFVTSKSDTDFKRPNTSLVPIQTAPFYGIAQTVTHGATNNGTLNIDNTFHVLDVSGTSIPRLYAAGDNGKAGLLSGTGVHVCWSYTSGRAAGQNAAKETPWS